MVDTFSPAVTLILLAVILWIVVQIATRILARRQQHPAFSKTPYIIETLAPNNEAVIMARPHGQVIYTNDPARQLFGLNGHQPNLTRMARLVKPRDSFYELFAAEGQASLVVADYEIQATSIRLPSYEEDDPCYVIVLREVGYLSNMNYAESHSTVTTAALSEISRIIASSLDLDTTLRNILTTTRRVISYQFAEIAIWDETTQTITPIHRDGEQAYVQAVSRDGHELEQLAPQYAEWRTAPHQTLLITDTLPDDASEADAEIMFRSLAAVPMKSGSQIIGALELASTRPHTYSKLELELLEIIAGQAGVAIRNAQLYAEQRRSLDELSGLVSVAQTASLISDPKELIEGLTERIANLMEVKICGFLLYNDHTQELIAQEPVRGLPEAYLGLYQLPILPDSPIEEILNHREWWYSNDVANDDLLGQTAEFQNLARTIGITNTIMVPMIVGGRRIGLIQASNKTNDDGFDDNEARLLAVFAGQAAALIDNARLINEASHRAHRSEGARLLAELAASAQMLDDILSQAIEMTVSLLNADLSVVVLLDETTGDLIPHQISAIGDDKHPLAAARIRANIPGYQYTVTQTQRTFFTGRASRDERIVEPYREALEVYKVESVIIVPLIVEERSIGELWIGGYEEYSLQSSDIELALIAAVEIASAIGRAELAAKTDEDLRRRAEQLTAITRISRELNQTLELERVLTTVIAEAQRATRGTGSIVILKRDTGSQPAVAQRLGDLPADHPLTSPETEVIINGESRIIDEMSEDQRPTPEAHSALIVPIAYQAEIVGLIHLYSNYPRAFDRNMLEFASILSGQAAIAVGNAQRYQEQIHRGELLRRRANQLEHLLEISRTIRSDQPLSESLEAIALGIQESTDFNEVMISRYDPETQQLNHLIAAGVSRQTLKQLQERPQPWSQIEPALKDEFRLSESYYVPHDPKQQTSIDLAHHTWQPGDKLIIPLNGTGGELLGTIQARNPREENILNPGTIKSIEIFANQATLAIENAKLFEAAQMQATQLEDKLAELSQSYAEADKINRRMQRKDSELREALSQLDERAALLLSLHRITSAISGLHDQQSLAEALAESVVKEMDMDVCLLLQTTGNQRTILAAGGYHPPLNDEWLVQHNPIEQAIKQNSPLLVKDLSKSGWNDSAMLLALALKSFIALPIPISVNANQQGLPSELNSICMLIGSQQPQSILTADTLDIFTLLAREASSALDNAILYSEIQELQELNEAVLHSIDQGLIVINTQQEILIINTALETILPNITIDIIGKPVFTQAPILQTAELEENIKQVIQSGNPFDPIQLTFTDQNEKPRHLSVSGYALRQKDQVSGVVLLVEDLSDRAELERTSRERAIQLEALTKVSRVISSTLRLEDVAALVLDQVDRVTPYDCATLWLQEDGQLQLMAARGYNDNETREGMTVTIDESPLYNEMATARKPIMVADVHLDNRFPAGKLQPRRSWLGVPLISKDQILGSLILEKEQAGYYNPQHIEIALSFANQAAVALDNARLFEESWERSVKLNDGIRRLERLNQVSIELGTSLDIDEILQVGLASIAIAIESRWSDAIIFDQRTQTGRVATSYNRVPRTQEPPEMLVPLEKHLLIAELEQTKQAILIESVRTDTRIEPIRNALLARDAEIALFIPLVSSGQILGIICIYENIQQHQFESDEIKMAQTIANQVAIALDNAYQHKETEMRLAELGTIYEMSQLLTATIDLEPLFAILGEKISEVLNTQNLYLALYDASIDEMTFPLIYENGQPIANSHQLLSTLPAHIIKTRQPLLLDGDTDSAQLKKLGDQMMGAKSYLGVPLIAAEQVIGVLAIQDMQNPYAYTQGHNRILTTIAGQVAVAIENAHLFTQITRATQELEQRVEERTADLQTERDRVGTLLRITTELSASLDLDRVLTKALTLVKDSIGATQGSLFLIDPQSNQIIYRSALGSPKPLPPGGIPVPFQRGEGLIGWVIQERSTAIIDNLDNDERWIQRPFSHVHKSAMAVPLLASEDLLGALIFYSDIEAAFDEAQLHLVTAAASQVGAAINNAELYRLIRDQAERLGGMLRTHQLEVTKSRAILESVADGVLVADEDGNIIVFNGAAEQILQLQRSQVLRHNISEFRGFYGRSGQIWHDVIRQWQETPENYQAGDMHSEQVETDDQRILSVHLSPVFNGEEFIGSVSLFRDITREVEVDRLKTEFVTIVSHELRTPMTSIKGFTDILLMGAGGKLEPMQTEFIQKIKSNADRMTTLVEDLLDISKIESGNIELNLMEVDMRDIIEEVGAHLEGRIYNQGKEMKMVLNRPDTLPLVMADRNRITQVITNLTDNAYNYTPEGGTITVEVLATEEGVQINVIDTGVGLTEETKKRVFERFYREDDNPLVMASAGTGLGLNIVQRLVDMHNGKIWAESPGLDQGSTFSVLIPYLKEDSSDAPSQTAAEEGEN